MTQDEFSHFKLSNLILCAGTLLKKNNKIILLKNNKTNEIVLPKGKLEKKESLIETAERETYEETGYNCRTISKEPFCMTIRKNKQGNKIIFWFMAVASEEKYNNTQKGDENFINLECTKEEALEMLTFDSDKLVIKECEFI